MTILNESFLNSVRNEALSKRSIQVDNFVIDLGTEGPLILRDGELWLITAEVRGGKWGKHYVLVSPSIDSVTSRKESFLRIDSGCLSGVVFGDITCDCLQQLRQAQKVLLKKGGTIVHIPSQDGRGWQEYKMANQRLMKDCGLDTIDAAIQFYGDKNIIDSRTFNESAIILRALGFPEGYKFVLGTSNLAKVEALRDVGFEVQAYPVEVPKLSSVALRNLSAKYKHWGIKKEK